MRIAIIVPRLSGIGGIAQHARKLVEWLELRGHQVITLTAPYIRLHGLASPSASLMLIFKGLAYRIYKRADVDVVHIHHILQYPAGKIISRPLVLTLHGDILKQYEMLHRWSKPIISLVERAAVRGASEVTAISPLIAEIYEKRYGRRIWYVPNAIDLRDIPNVKQKEDDMVVFVGRLSPEKGIDLLLEAANILEKHGSRLKIVIVGDGPLREKVVRFAEKHRNVIYVGFKPREEALQYICRASMLILPSRAEGFPTVILEAFACRTLVVATGIPEIKALFSPNEIVFVTFNPLEIARAIQQYLEDNAARRRLTERAYSLLVSRYTWDRVVDMYISVYRKAIESQG